VFTIGGLVGSLWSNRLQDRFGRKGALRFSGGFTALGAGFIAVALNYNLLLFGRYVNLGTYFAFIPSSVVSALAGVGAGIGLCVGPIFLSEIAPEKIRGSVGWLQPLHAKNLVLTFCQAS
jgi:SP family facilitated glucose transporter-like MFS transporter 3